MNKNLFALIFLPAFLMAFLPPANAAVPKTGAGGVSIVDDLTGRSAGSVGLSHASGISLSGSLGQIGNIESNTVESGYFSKGVSGPTVGEYQVYSTSISLSWNDTSAPNPAGTFYVIQVSTASDFSVFTASDIFTASPAAVAGLQPNTTYYARIRASYMEGDDSAWAELTGSTMTYTAPVLAWTAETNYVSDGLNPEIGVLAATAFVYRVKYTDADNDAPASGYPRVHIKKGGAKISGSPFAMTYVSGAYNTGSVYAYSTRLPAGTDYSYDFTAQDANGAGATGAPLTTADAPDIHIRPPAVPTHTGNYSVSPNLSFEWKQGSADDPSGIAGYQLQVGSDTAANNAALFDGTAGNVFETVSGAQDGVTYYARVRAISGIGAYSLWSAWSNGIRVDLTPPSPPLVISLTHPDSGIGYCSAAPSFQVSGSSDSSGIAEHRWKIDILAASVPNALDTLGAGQTMQFDNLLPDGTWYFHVAAKDVAGNMGTEAGHYKLIVKTAVYPAVSDIYTVADGATLEIPAGTINNATNLQIRIPASTEIPSGVYDPAFRVTPAIKEIKFLDGTKQLDKDLALTLKYADSDVRGLDASSLRIAYYDETAGDWRVIGRSVPYLSAKKVTAAVSHLTLFAVVGAPSGYDAAIFGLTNYPNPFTAGAGGTTKIRYSLKGNSNVEIKIYDLIGDLVWKKTISAGEVAGGVAGPNEIPWNGKNGKGRYVSAGGYICVVKAGDGTQTTKIGVK